MIIKLVCPKIAKMGEEFFWNGRIVIIGIEMEFYDGT